MSTRRKLLIMLVFAGAGLGGLGACGSEIGDSCSLSSDCSPSGDRICDLSQDDGYCTVVGCDYDTCPEEGVCIRFFVGQFDDKPCDPVTEDLASDSDACTFDEVCPLQGFCVPRSAEARYCMRKCDGNDDCRGGYECRTRELMLEHGGEPVLAPGVRPEGNLPRFCAQSPI